MQRYAGQISAAKDIVYVRALPECGLVDAPSMDALLITLSDEAVRAKAQTAWRRCLGGPQRAPHARR